MTGWNYHASVAYMVGQASAALGVIVSVLSWQWSPIAFGVWISVWAMIDHHVWKNVARKEPTMREGSDD